MNRAGGEGVPKTQFWHLLFLQILFSGKISLEIAVYAHNRLVPLRALLFKVRLMYSQWTWKVRADYTQLKGFQNTSLEALPLSSKFPSEFPGG